MENQGLLRDVGTLVFEGIEDFDKTLKTMPDLENGQPEGASWVTVDIWFSDGSATDYSGAIAYKNEHDMQQAIIRFVQAVWTPELLEYVRSGEVNNLTLRIGPHSCSEGDLNRVHGFRPRVASFEKGI